MVKKLGIAAVLLAWAMGAAPGHAATTNWTGATNTDWNTAGNWDNGVPNTSGSYGDGAISLTTGGPVVAGAVPAAGAVSLTTTGGGVLSVGLDPSGSPAGSANFSSLEIVPNGLGQRVFIGRNSSLTLSGNGDPLKIHATNNSEAWQINSVTSGTAPTLYFTGTNLTFGTTMSAGVTAIGFGSATAGNFRLYFPNVTTSIDFGGKILQTYGGTTGVNQNGELHLSSKQTWTNLPMISFGGSAARGVVDLVNDDPSNPLNLPNTDLRWQSNYNNAHLIRMAGGTYKSIMLESYRNATSDVYTLQLQGDVTTVGLGSNNQGVTLNAKQTSARTTLDLNGHTLHVNNASATPNFGANNTGAGLTWINLNGGELRADNGVALAANGYAIGSGTIRVNGGRFTNNSTQTAMNLTAATIALGASATGIDWNAGSIDVSGGLDSTSFTAANFSLANIGLGTGSYTLGGGDAHDLLIGGTLSLTGTLDLGDWSSVGGTLGGELQTLAFDDINQRSVVDGLIAGGKILATGTTFGPGLGLGTVLGTDGDSFYIGVVGVPEPATLGLLLMGGLSLLARRTRKA